MEVNFSGEAFVEFIKAGRFRNMLVEFTLVDDRRLEGYIAGIDSLIDGVILCSDNPDDHAAERVPFAEMISMKVF